MQSRSAVSFSARAATGPVRPTCGLRSGNAFCWGHGGHGQLGITMTDSLGATHSTCPFTPVQNIYECPVPAPVLGGLSFKSLAAGWNHSCGIESSGAAHCWGVSAHGAIGTDSSHIGDFRQPVPVAGNISFAILAGGRVHTCGLSTSGVVYCWGDNRLGQLGDGTGADRRVPAPVASTLHFSQLGGGSSHVCGVAVGGSAYCWGENQFGQIGNGTIGGRVTIPTSVVVQPAASSSRQVPGR